MEFKSKLKKRPLNGQCRELVANLLNFMKKEAIQKEPIIPLAKVHERVSAALGICLRTIGRIAKESQLLENGEVASYSTPKKRPNRKPRVLLDDVGRTQLRKSILNCHITHKTVPTLKKIHRQFSQEFEYEGSRESLRKEIHMIGFKWKKTRNDRKILVERDSIRHLRLEFLRKIKQFRESGRTIVYTDETYIHSSHTHEKGWSNNSTSGLMKPTSKGPRMIIINAGSEEGFVPNAYLRWKSNIKSGDYHDEMNFENFEKWLKQHLIPNLPLGSVIVLDNASYHNKLAENLPTSSTKKIEMQQWLTARNIAFDNSLLKPQLYAIIKNYKPRFKRYCIDELLISHGFDVVRLPPYHPELNPIELVWSSMKHYVAEKNVDFNFNKVGEYCDEFFSNFSGEMWKSRCSHAKKFETEYMAIEPLLDQIIDELIIDLQDDDDDEDNESGSEFDVFEESGEDDGNISRVLNFEEIEGTSNQV